eukprot:2161867-Rhodomonas_salina.2
MLAETSEPAPLDVSARQGKFLARKVLFSPSSVSATLSPPLDMKKDDRPLIWMRGGGPVQVSGALALEHRGRPFWRVGAILEWRRRARSARVFANLIRVGALCTRYAAAAAVATGWLVAEPA